MTKKYYKVWRVLQSKTEFITKCDKYYRVWQVLWEGTVITKLDLTNAGPPWSCFLCHASPLQVIAETSNIIF